jgi:Zn-dependent protease with chaperone function
VLGLLWLFAAGCATTAPPRAAPRAPSDEERRALASLLVPLLVTSGIWSGPADGCAAALGIRPVEVINVGVAPHPQCKFALVITEAALKTLPPEELQAALAHELGHVQLGHFTARRERRAEERKTREEINEKSSAGALGAIPLIGPLLAVGMMGTQMAADAVVEGKYRAYDREEELAADRFALDLLQRITGRAQGCRATMALLDRLRREGSARIFSAWLSTHPRPSDRLKAVTELCPA